MISRWPVVLSGKLFPRQKTVRHSQERKPVFVVVCQPAGGADPVPGVIDCQPLCRSEQTVDQ